MTGEAIWNKKFAVFIDVARMYVVGKLNVVDNKLVVMLTMLLNIQLVKSSSVSPNSVLTIYGIPTFNYKNYTLHT